MSMKIYMVITYLPQMRIIKLTLAIGIVPFNKLQQNDFDWEYTINEKMPKIDTLDALEEHEEHEDDYQTNSNW